MMTPEERRELFFQRFVNGYNLSNQTVNPDYKLLTELQSDKKRWKIDYANPLDVLWLARVLNSKGLLRDSGDCSEINGMGCEWLAPYYSFVQYKLTELRMILKQEGDEQLTIFGMGQWNKSPKELIELHTNDDDVYVHNSISHRLEIHNFENYKPEKEEQVNLLFESFYKAVGKMNREKFPLKKATKEKRDLYDVDFWDSRLNQTALETQSIVDLLNKHGYKKTFIGQKSIKELKEFEKEIKEKRIIQEIRLIESKHKAKTSASYHKEIQRHAQISCLFALGIIKLDLTVDKKKVLDNKYWKDPMRPTICSHHHIFEMTSVQAVTSEDALKIFPKFPTKPSIRDCYKMFKILKDWNFKDYEVYADPSKDKPTDELITKLLEQGNKDRISEGLKPFTFEDIKKRIKKGGN